MDTFPRSEPEDPPSRLAEPVAPHDHLVGLYETEPYLVECVARFVEPALTADDGAVVVATPAHREQIDAALAHRGVDTAAARRQGRLFVVDAAELLAAFMVDGAPDPVRFAEHVGGLVDRASAGGTRLVRVHGEMVARLWEHGEVPAALALEDRWNELLEARPVALLCTYPMRCFDREETSEAFHTVCQQHAAVLPSESYAELADADARRREVALLQHEAIVGINARTALRRRQHELEEELRRARELGRLRDELIAGLVDGVRPTAEGDETGAHPRSPEAFHKTAVRTLRRVLDAAGCAFEPAGVGGEAAVAGELEDGEAETGTLTVAVSSGETRHGTLRVQLGAARNVTVDDAAAAEVVADLLAAAVEHDLAARGHRLT